MIAADAADFRGSKGIIYLGDYIDRGETPPPTHAKTRTPDGMMAVILSLLGLAMEAYAGRGLDLRASLRSRRIRYSRLRALHPAAQGAQLCRGGRGLLAETPAGSGDRHLAQHAVRPV